MTITLPEIEQSEVDAAIEQLITDLENARDYIDKHGLIKDMYASVLTNARCTDGAIMAVTGRGSGLRRLRALYALATTLGAPLSEMDATAAVHEFNDADGVERDDVIGLFNTTIDRLRA